MLLDYRNPSFWRDFHQAHWKPEIPTVLRNPFREFPFTEEMVLNALKTFHSRLQERENPFRYLFSPETSLGETQKIFKSVFRSPVLSMDEFGRKSCEALSRKRMGLMVNNLQSLDSRLWDSATAFLHDAHPWIDFPMGRCIIDLFFGNYSKSFLGLHKDMQEILGFVVKGEKTIYAWPFEYFLSKVPGLTQADRYFQLPLPIDYRPYVKDALVLKAQAGDIIYWPSSYWHTAVGGTSGDFPIFLSLGLFRAAHSSAQETEALLQFRKKLLLRPSYGTEGDRVLYSQEVPAQGKLPAASSRLRWATAYSFPLGAPPEPALWRKMNCEKFFLKPSVLLLWMVFPEKKKVLVSANGHRVVLGHSAPLGAFLKRLSGNKGTGLKTRASWKKQDARAKLARWLVRHGCVA